MVEEKALGKEDQADGDDDNAHPLDQLVQRADHLRLLLVVHGLGLHGQTGDVGVLPHLVQPGPALPGHHKAAGHELIPLSLGDLVGLACQQGLVDLYLPCGYHCVRADLIARAEDDDVIQHQLLGIHLSHLSVPDHPGVGRVQHAHLLQHILGPHLLDNADQGVDNDHREEGQVPEGAHQAEQHAQHDKDQVEVGKYIFMYDLLCRLGRRIHRDVGPPVHPVLLHLLGAKPLRRVRVIPGRADPPVSPLTVFLYFFLHIFLSFLHVYLRLLYIYPIIYLSS